MTLSLVDALSFGGIVMVAATYFGVVAHVTRDREKPRRG